MSYVDARTRSVSRGAARTASTTGVLRRQRVVAGGGGGGGGMSPGQLLFVVGLMLPILAHA